MKFLLLAATVVLANGQDPPPAAQEGYRTVVQCSSPEKGRLVSLMEEMKGMMQGEVTPLLKTLLSLHNTTTQDNSPPRHCKDLLDSGDSESGLRDVFPDPDQPHHRVEVYCEQEIDGGGWTVFQRRSNDTTRQSFERTWAEYEEGFGDKNGEFWLGLRDIHLLTNMAEQELRVDLEDSEGGHHWAKYAVFYVDSQDTNYRLTVDRYSGIAGDAMASIDGAEFSTPDADHDTSSVINCAARYRGGWWYQWCGAANLNGYLQEGPYLTYDSYGIWWGYWRRQTYVYKRTTMMIRPAPEPLS